MHGCTDVHELIFDKCIEQTAELQVQRNTLLFLMCVFVYYIHLSWDHSKSVLFYIHPVTLWACSSTIDLVWMHLSVSPAWIVWFFCLLSMDFVLRFHGEFLFFYECHSAFDRVVTSNLGGNLSLCSLSCPERACAWEKCHFRQRN